MKYIWYIIAAIVIIGGLWYVMTMNSASVPETPTVETPASATVVAPGTYTVDTTSSTVAWSGAKPLISGYIDSGTIGIKDGSITVTDSSATATITMDMNTVHVGTTFKTGKEGALEDHLKKSDFFDVTTYPTATFTITTVTPRSDSATTFMYDVTGTLTMKGKTGDVSFPAKIFAENGVLHAEASTTIDRTKWNITFGSKNFFDNLADNAIDDLVQLKLTLVATK
jgi:polyisoprenoid-binding protein YceI